MILLINIILQEKVEPGNTKEMYRAHFDSHLFTMVLPLKIPETTKDGTAGDLIYFQNARKVPSNEISNFFGKAYYKRFASKEGIEKFSSNHQKKLIASKITSHYFLSETQHCIRITQSHLDVPVID